MPKSREKGNKKSKEEIKIPKRMKIQKKSHKNKFNLEVSNKVETIFIAFLVNQNESTEKVILLHLASYL